MPTYARPPRRGDQFTHLRSLDLNWTPGPGQLYVDGPKARMVVTAVRNSRVYYAYAEPTERTGYGSSWEPLDRFMEQYADQLEGR